MSDNSKNTIIPILGMHRSGTSMIARALNLMGLVLGEPLLEPTPDNPKGYWENTYFLQINIELLRTMNCNDDGFAGPGELRRLPELSSRIVVDDSKLAEFAQFIARTFGNSTWGWKDPRTVLTFDVWLRMLSDLGFRDIRPVIIVRHPAASAQSLVRRVLTDPANAIPSNQLHTMAANVWTAYNGILWERCSAQNWFVGTYESFTNPATCEFELIRPGRYCGLNESPVLSALESIECRIPRVQAPTGTDRFALALYEQFRERARQQTSAGEFTDAVVRADPDETRLLKKAEELKQAGRIDAAVDLLTKALDIRPHYRAARFLLGYTLMETGHITQSHKQARLLIEANPQDPVGHGLQAFGLTQQARIEEAIAAFRECIRLLPTNNVAWSNLLFSSLYGDHRGAAEVTALHVEASRAIEGNVKQQSRAWNLPPLRPATANDRPLRIGYLSGDLKKHPVGYFLRSILQHHDRQQVHATCYHIGPGEDDLTAVLRRTSDAWCDANGLSDEELTRRIRSDGIDVLIDLAGHSAGNRAGVIATRAAPVQAMYIGYPSTSGLSAMDFVISDHHISPPEFDSLYTERVQRLDNCFLCFHPYDDAPEVAPPPRGKNGFITFGSFNNLPKLSATTIRLWSDVLKAVPDSRLAIKALSFVDAGTRDLFHEHFAEQGIERSRIDLLPPTVPLGKFLDEYRRIDIGLDPVPFNGGTTTFEALWMGVPVITLPGRHFFSRMGLSILKTLGHEEWIANSRDAYVRRASELAADPNRLRQVRTSLRDEMKNSPLCDGTLFTRGMEQACRSMLQSAGIGG